MKDYSAHVIIEYKFWSLQVEEDQNYLGRCVVFCKRDDVLDLSETNQSEQQEFFQILREIKEILNLVFKPDLINYTFLSNKTPHLHCHIIPRYKSPREFMGTTFVDEKWGSNPYKGEYKSFISQEIYEGVRQKLVEAYKDRFL